MGVEWLKGKACSRVYEHSPGNSTFEFGGATLAVDCLWRVIADGKVALTSRDQGQQFGLPAPIDARAAAASHLQGSRVGEARLDERSADLVLEFEHGKRLEVLTDSSGYEPWNLHAPGVHLVALGGGGIARFPAPAPRERQTPAGGSACARARASMRSIFTSGTSAHTRAVIAVEISTSHVKPTVS